MNADTLILLVSGYNETINDIGEIVQSEKAPQGLCSAAICQTIRVLSGTS